MIHFEFDLSPSDITSPHPFGMALLSLHLFCQLPDYLPRQTINFTGRNKLAKTHACNYIYIYMYS